MDLQPLFGLPAARLGDTVLISDVHLGIEREFARGGIILPPQTRTLIERLGSLPATRRLLILGDLKHPIGTDRRTTTAVEGFVTAALGRFAEVTLVKGNHDGGFPWEEYGIDLIPSGGFREGDYGFLHGHRFPDPEVLDARFLVTGHNHPAVLFQDEIGSIAVEPAWFRIPGPGSAEDQDLIMVPSFNEVCGGSPVNVSGQRFLGPLIGRGLFDPEGGQIHTLDGIELGTRNELLVSRRGMGFRGRRNERMPFTSFMNGS